MADGRATGMGDGLHVCEYPDALDAAVARFDRLLDGAEPSPAERRNALDGAETLMEETRSVLAEMGSAFVTCDQACFAVRVDNDPTGFMMSSSRELRLRGKALLDVIAVSLRKQGYVVLPDPERDGIRIAMT